VFVEAELPIALTFEVAKRALDRALADGGLVAESRRAVEDGLVFVMPVGPRGARGPSTQVMVKLLPSRYVGEGLVVPLRWEVTGPAGALFPALDANLELRAVNPLMSQFLVIGRYEPPLGRLGARMDRAGMSKVASATMTALLRELEAQLRRWA
jgi:hypothetical protein